ncbi:MAG TPA: hypothetical protein VH743_15725 [Beijerinckiaceae bacterium]
MASRARAIDRGKHAGNNDGNYHGEYVVLQQQLANLGRLSMKSIETGMFRHFITLPR